MLQKRRIFLLSILYNKTWALLFSFLMLSLNASITYAQSEQTKNEIRANIDWMNGETGLPTRARTYLRSVPAADGSRTIRGPLSAQGCLNFATIFALAGLQQYGIEWLQAGQDHNPNVQSLFASNPSYCVEYIRSQYRNQAAQAFAVGSIGEWVKAALSEIKKNNPPPDKARGAPAYIGINTFKPALGISFSDVAAFEKNPNLSYSSLPIAGECPDQGIRYYLLDLNESKSKMYVNNFLDNPDLDKYTDKAHIVYFFKNKILYKKSVRFFYNMVDNGFPNKLAKKMSIQYIHDRTFINERKLIWFLKIKLVE